MSRGWTVVVWTALLVVSGGSNRLEVTLEDSEKGFFIKNPQALGSNKLEHQFVITRPTSGAVDVRAKYGEFVAKSTVTPELLHRVLGNDTFWVNNLVVKGFDVSAHVVTPTVTQERPLLQVLFHASQFLPWISGSGIKGAEGTLNDHSPMWCMQMHVIKDNQRLTSVCVLSEHSNVCIAEQTLPAEWWHLKRTESADVYYTAYNITQKLQCSSSSYYITPDRGSLGSNRHSIPVRTYVSPVTLTHGQPAYQELKEDQHILIHNPQTSFYPGSKFKVPVKLQAESDLETFVIKVRARHGIHVLGAEPCSERWSIRTDLNSKQHQGMVTASISNPLTYRKTAKVQDIFNFIFEVDPGASGEDRGRLTFTLEYERGGNRERYSPVENRVVARIQIQGDNTYTIVPITKVTEIVNTAVLTGKIQKLPMRVYSVSQLGRISDITSQTTCHSGDENVLKVAQSCNLVYLDGTETSGRASVSVIAKYGRHNQFLFFKVWLPQLPLEIELSDSKLSQIKQWRAPRQQRRSLPFNTRKTRGVAFGILTPPSQLLTEQGMRAEDFSTTCNLRFQQTQVEVYTRFVFPDNVGTQYLIHRKMLFRVTDLVKDLLRVADSSVANLTSDGTVIEGLQPGRTEIQVLSRQGQGRIMGAKEVRVGNDRVEIEGLEVDVITGLDLDLLAHPGGQDMPGFLTASVFLNNDLHRKDQEGFLDISVVFDDGTRMPLRNVDPADYFLDTKSLNNMVVVFDPVPEVSPRFNALGQGAGDLLEVSLNLADACQRKNSHSLAVHVANINVDLVKPRTEPGLQMDASQGQSYSNKPPTGQNGSGSWKGSSKLQNYYDTIDHDDDKLVVSKDPPYQEAQQQPILEASNLTPLEIGMYVLLGVFCLAIVVFMVNCMIFVVRYRNKRNTRKGKEHVSQAADWVWIGRDTLERNAINTTCRQTLMPDADFNGNHSGQQQLLPPTSLPPSNRNSSASSGAASGSLRDASNRNSMVSTYKGSECSIRITANPIMDENDNPQTDDTAQAGANAPLMPQGAGPSKSLPRRSVSRFSGRGLSTIGSSLDSDSLRRRKLAELEEAVASGSELEFDYESLGMTYEELMEYFDNLKESTA